MSENKQMLLTGIALPLWFAYVAILLCWTIKFCESIFK